VCSKANFRKNYFSVNFPSVSVFQCEASGRVRLRQPDGQVTRSDARILVACLCGIARPDGDPTGLYIAFSALATAFHLFFSCLFVILLRFFCGFSHIFDIFCPFAFFYLISRYITLSLSCFSNLLTVRIFLWKILEIKIAYLYL
jgi:hypothetical protein